LAACWGFTIAFIVLSACGPSALEVAATIVAATASAAGTATATFPTSTPTVILEPTHTPSATPVPTATPTPLGGGGPIAFASNRFGHFDIYTINSNGEEIVRLTTDLLEDTDPAWSPDGMWIAYTSGGKTRSFDLYVVSPGGGSGHLLVKGNGYGPVWSPDGAMIVRVQFRCHDAICRQNSYELAAVNADGTGLRFLTSNPDGTYYNFPDWSPDGSLIAFTRSGGGDIFLMAPDGTGSTNLTKMPGASNYEPNWSPDGGRIAFTSDRDGNDEIYVMDLTGSGVQRLTNHLGADRHPTWSPDGRLIAFSSNRGGSFDIYVLELEAGKLIQLTSDPADEIDPDWSNR